MSWSPYADEYKPLEIGSIDKTDTIPHDRGIWRAMNTVFTPPKLNSDPNNIVFVSHLPFSVTEKQISDKFSRCGKLQNVKLVRDVITGFSRGYAFVEFTKKRYAERALKENNFLEFSGRKVLVEPEIGRKMKGWIPRRLGGGFGGRKESGQLRFGCNDRLWKKPIMHFSDKISQPVTYNKDVMQNNSNKESDSRVHNSTDYIYNERNHIKGNNHGCSSSSTTDVQYSNNSKSRARHMDSHNDDKYYKYSHRSDYRKHSYN